MIRPIPTSLVREYWPKVLPLLKPAIELGRRATPDETLKWLERGDYQLWVTQDLDGAATTAIQNYPGSKWLCIVHCGGKNMRRWLHAGIAALEHWAVSNGCVDSDGQPLVEIIGRVEWGNVLPGYKATGVVVERFAHPIERAAQ